MQAWDIKPGERVKNVAFTGDTLAVDLADGRLWCLWFGTRDFSTPPRNSAGTGKSALGATAFVGRISMRI